MPKSDTWPGGVPMDSLISNDSAGSCDSVISMHSGFSDDSLEYLSAEEKACLMFLEETIESLELEEDSGLSNDEPETGRLAPAVTHPATRTAQSTTQGEPSLKHKVSSSDQKSNISVSVPMVLLQKSVAGGLPDNVQYQSTSPQPPSQTNGTNTPVPDLVQASRSTTDRRQPASFAVTEITLPAMDVCNGSSRYERSQVEGGTPLIPPPSDFMDESEPELELVLPALAAQVPLADSQLVGQHTKASVQKAPPHHLETDKTPSIPTVKPPVQPGFPLPPLEIPHSPPADSVELKSPPVVAPKPKKLPSNIVLKSHKASLAVGSDVGATDHVHVDPQKVRMEALMKLGLLKADQGESPIHPGAGPSPNIKRRGTAPSSSYLGSRAASHTAATTAAAAPVKSSVSAATSSLPAAIKTENLLAPPALFSDSPESLPTNAELPSLKELPESVVTVNAPVDNCPHSPALGFKSTTLEHSDMDSGSYSSSQGPGRASPPEGRPNQQRQSRLRPASLGSGKDFTDIQGVLNQPSSATTTTTGKEPESGRPLPALQAQHAPSAGGDSSQHLPRSHGISVLICPSESSDEERRKALRRLGLIKD